MLTCCYIMINVLSLTSSYVVNAYLSIANWSARLLVHDQSFNTQMRLLNEIKF